MVKITPPKLRQPELPTVNAFVKDTFYRPDTRPTSPALQDLANSLSNLVPTLRRYDIKKEEIFAEDETDRAIADFNQNKDAFKNLVKNGVIPEGASPYYINALAKQQLKLDGREFKERLFDEWNNGNVWRDDDPAAFEKFYRTFSDNFKQEKKIDSYAPSTVVEGFLPDADAAYNELAQRNREKRIAEIELQNVDLLNKNITSIIDDFQSLDFDTPEQEEEYLSNMVQQQLDFMIDNHMNPRVANETIVDAIVSQALRYEDEEYLDIINNITTDGNSKLSGTAYADKALKETPLEIYKLRQLKANNEYNNYVKAKTINDRMSLNNFVDFIESDEGNVINILDFIKQENVSRKEQGIPELDADIVNDLNNLATNYVDAKNPRFVENLDFVNDFRTKVYQNPNLETLSGELRDALGNDINIETYKLLDDELRKAQDFREHNYRKDLTYQGIINQVTKYNPQFGDENDEYFTNIANIRINQLTDSILSDLVDENFRKENNLNTVQQEKDYLNSKIQQEVNRIFEQFNLAGIDVPEVVTGNVNQSQAASTILNPNYNPFK